MEAVNDAKYAGQNGGQKCWHKGNNMENVVRAPKVVKTAACLAKTQARKACANSLF